MFRCVVNWLRPENKNALFNKEYRAGFNNSWINKIRHYRP